MVESQPLGRHTLHYRIRDAKTGELEHGEADVRELRKRQPWAAPTTALHQGGVTGSSSSRFTGDTLSATRP
jgi:hypothetical protein